MIPLFLPSSRHKHRLNISGSFIKYLSRTSEDRPLLERKVGNSETFPVDDFIEQVIMSINRRHLFCPGSISPRSVTR